MTYEKKLHVKISCLKLFEVEGTDGHCEFPGFPEVLNSEKKPDPDPDLTFKKKKPRSGSEQILNTGSSSQNSRIRIRPKHPDPDLQP